MCLAMRDFRDVWDNILFFFGRRREPPRFAQFSYMEKVEYWALLWGTIIMTVTGLLLWFDDYFVERWGLPKGLLDVMLVIHYYEAWLATLAIIVWHLYGTVYSPAVYPMNTAWLAGRMAHRVYEHEHPDGPRLKRRITRPKIAEELEDEARTTAQPADTGLVGARDQAEAPHGGSGTS
jgi:cytochrome b subunit of formate dehydrogenase